MYQEIYTKENPKTLKLIALILVVSFFFASTLHFFLMDHPTHFHSAKQYITQPFSKDAPICSTLGDVTGYISSIPQTISNFFSHILSLSVLSISTLLFTYLLFLSKGLHWLLYRKKQNYLYSEAFADWYVTLQKRDPSSI